LLVEALDGSTDFVKKHALQALGRTAGSAEDAAVRALVAADGTSPVIRAYGNYTLLSGGDASVGKTLLDAAGESQNPDIREVAAVALALVDSKESRVALDKLAKETDKRVALAAVASKAALGDQDAVGQIIQIIGYGPVMEATVMAGALKRLPPAMAGQITETLLDCCPLKNDAATRLLESWGWIKGDASRVYDWGLKHKEADIRMQTVWLIGQRKDESAVARLVPFLTDQDAGIRGMAAWAIVHITGHRYVGGVAT